MSKQRIEGDLDRSYSHVSSSRPEIHAASSAGKSFSSLMQNTSSGTDQAVLSPLQLPQVATAGPPNPTTILAQLQLAQASVTNLQGQLNNPNLKLNNTQKATIKKKLSSANDYIQTAHQKVGGSVESKQEEDAGDVLSKEKGPIAQFLGLLTDGMEQLESTKHFVKNMGTTGMLSPGDFLLVQLKLAKAQQELEFTGVLLSKTIDGFKQIMSIQL